MIEENEFFPGGLQRILMLREELRELESFIERKTKQHTDLCLVICAIAEYGERTYRQIAARIKLEDDKVREICHVLVQNHEHQPARVHIFGTLHDEKATISLTEEGRTFHQEMFRVT